MNKYSYYLGVDGCQCGWICSHQNFDKVWKFEIFSTIKSLWKTYNDSKLVLIDIPIGLRDEGNKPRLCDAIARKYLTRKRSSSIFPPPCRSAVYSASYIEANYINKELTGKGLSKQAWNISNKIREVDTLLKTDNKAREIFIESHPELCFASLSKQGPMNYYKKTKDDIQERLSVISLFYLNPKNLLDTILNQFLKQKINIDDILDSWILAISGSKGKEGLEFLPNNYEYDSEGLPMRIVIPKYK